MWLLLATWMTAGAADHELSLQVGATSTPPEWEHMAGPGEPDPFFTGLRLGVRVADPLLIVGEWGAGRGVFGLESTAGRVAIATTHHQSGLGVKLAPFVNVPIVDPYVVAQGTLGASLMRLDDDRSSEFNANQLRYRRATPGAYAAIGMGINPPHDFTEVGAGGYLELGYSAALPYDFAEMGTVRVSGLSMRVGIGLRF